MHTHAYADHIPAYADVISALQTCAQNVGLRILAPYNCVPSYAEMVFETHGAPYVHEELSISRKTPPIIEYLKGNWLIRARPYILRWSARA